MAQRKSRSSSKRRSRSSSKRRSQSSSKRKSQSRSQQGRRKQEYDDYSIVDPSDIPDGPDVLVDVPVVKVDKIDIEVDDLRAQVAVRAEVRKLVQLNVGAQARLGTVELQIEGVEAQALLKARLDRVGAIVDRVLLSLDRNPELLEGVGHAVQDVGGGTGKLLAESGEAVEDVGEGAGHALPQVGQGANQALGEIGQGGGQALGQLGQGAGQGLQGVGQGAQQLGKGGK
jgi:HSP20 family molecular chaperone IbpA